MGFNDDFRVRTKAFALRVIKLFRALPRTEESRVLGRQLLRSGTSVGANFRAATRARSKAEFISKIAIVAEEADESAYWMELLIESGIIDSRKLQPLHNEAIEITKITSSSWKTSRNNRKK